MFIYFSMGSHEIEWRFHLVGPIGGRGRDIQTVRYIKPMRSILDQRVHI